MDEDHEKIVISITSVAPTESAAERKPNRNSVEPSSSALAVKNAQLEQVAKLSTAVKGHLDSVLKVRPYRPHGLKPIPSRVLEEDDYVRLLQMIIERDFFPDLIKLRLQKEVIENERSSDFLAARDAAQRLEAVRIEQAGQRSGRISRIELNRRGPHQRVKLLDGREFELDISQLTLREFQSLFTSEDNSSFDKIVQEEKVRLSKEQAWIEQSAITHNALNEETRAALTSGERPARLLYSNLDSRNALMFPVTDGNIGVMEVKRIPGEGSDPEQTVALCVGTYPRDDEVGSQPSMFRGTIVHSNTRIETSIDDDDSLGTLMLESMSKEQQRKLGTAEKKAKEEALFAEMIQKGKYSASVIEHQRQLEFLNRKGGRGYRLQDIQNRRLETPTITPAHHGYRFLHTPAMDPGVGASPLMSWGKIAATPLLLSGGRPKTAQRVEESNEQRFQIPEPSMKEMTAQRLQEKASKKLRGKKSKKVTGLREALKSMTPLMRRGSKIGTGPSQLFGTPRMTGMELFRRHSLMTRTPLIGMNEIPSTPFTQEPRILRTRVRSIPQPTPNASQPPVSAEKTSLSAEGFKTRRIELSTARIHSPPPSIHNEASDQRESFNDKRLNKRQKVDNQIIIKDSNITDDLLEF